MKKRADGRYQKKITLPNGKRKMLYSNAANERLAAKDFNTQIMHLEKEVKAAGTFSSIAEEWSEDAFPKLQNNSLKLYKPGLAAAIDYFGDTPIADIKPLNVQLYADYLLSRKYAVKTVKNKLLVVSLIVKYAILHGYIDNDPTTRIRLPAHAQKSKRTAATNIEEDKIIASVDNPCGVLALFLLMTGCRRGEAVALTPKDINLEKKVVSITKTVEWIGNTPQIKNTPKTDAGVREIPIPESLIQYLKPLLKQEYLFPGKDGKLIGSSAFTDLWDRYRAETGIECTPHQLRHSYATMLFDAGIDVKTAQKWLGHTDIKTTLDIYTHLSESRLEKSTAQLTDFLESKFN